MNKRESRKVIIFTILILFAAILIFKSQQKDYSFFTQAVKLKSGESIYVNYKVSSSEKYVRGIGKRYVQWFEIGFEYKGRQYNWKSTSLPILLDFYNGTIYLVVEDAEEPMKVDFRFFKYQKKWVEIQAVDFPKSIAVQNMGLHENIGVLDGRAVSDHDVVEELNPDSSFFRDSQTAKLWLRLEKGKPYHESILKQVDKDFLIEFKRKYIVARQ